MNADFFKAIDELGKQKGIPTDIIIDRVEQALTKAYKHEKEGDCEIRIILDPDKKVFRMVELKEIVDEVTDTRQADIARRRQAHHPQRQGRKHL